MLISGVWVVVFRLGIHADRERYEAFDFGLVGPISTSCKFFLGAPGCFIC